MGEEKKLATTLGDFVTLLVREISQSLAFARYDAPLIQVQRVRIRFGEEKDSQSYIAQRYPFMADGWDVEMEMGTRLQPRLRGTLLPPVPQERALLDLFGSHPVGEIKGVNTDWSGFFTANGIITINDLESLTMTAIKDLAVQRPSVTLWEIHGKARLLRTPIPFFPSTALDGEKLYTILKMAPEDFLSRAGGTSITEIQRLADTMEILAIVLDATVLKSFVLEDLLSA